MLKTFQNRVEWQTRAPEPFFAARNEFGPFQIVLRAEVNDRLKLTREGMEDYEDLARLETFLKVRQELDEEVNKLARYRKPSDA
jgi:hypothetical protein